MTIQAGKTQGGNALMSATPNNPNQGSRPIGWNLMEPDNVPVVVGSDNVLRRPSGLPVGGGAVLVGAEKVRSMLSAIRTASWQRVSLAFHGHSIIAGAYSDDGVFDYASAQNWRTKSMAAMLSRALNGAVGGAWSSGIECITDPQRGFLTLGGGAAFSPAFSSGGIGGFVCGMTASGYTASFAAAGSTVRVYAYASAAGVTARYTVNGGATQNASVAPSTATGYAGMVWYEFTITGLTAGDTVQLMGPTSGAYHIYAVDTNYVTTAGVTVQRLGVSGAAGAQAVAAYLDDTDTQPGSSAFWTASGRAAQRAMQTDSVTTRLGVAGVLNMFDVNDTKTFGDSGNGTAWGWTIADHRRHMVNYLNAMASRSLPVVLCFGPLRDPSTTSALSAPYTQVDLINAYKDVADGFATCAYVDLTEEFTGNTLAERYAAQQATGLIFDSVHPGSRGSAYFGAQRIAQALLSA